MNNVIYSLIDPNTNEPRYIGQTINIKQRFLKHISDSKYADIHSRCWIKSLINQNLQPKIEILEICNNENELDFWEIFYISLYKSWGFKLTNMTTGGFRNKKLSTESRQKISNSLKGKKQNKITIEKRIVSIKKAWENEELKERQRNNYNIIYQKYGSFTLGKPSKKKGIALSEKTKIKLSNSLLKYWSSQAKKDEESTNKGAKYFKIYNVKKIVRGNRWGKGYVEKGEFIERHHNKSYIALKYNIERNHIRRCLNGDINQIKNLIFEYE